MILSVIYRNDVKVQSGLSLSPSEIDKMTMQGKAACLGSLEGAAYFDNLPSGAEVPIQDRRGTTLNTVWNASKDAQKKINTARIEVEKALNTQDPKLN